MNNEAFKHTAEDTQNETWTQLLLDLKFFDDMDAHDHIMYLRRKFVLGANDWMAGKNGSKQNDKHLFNYTDAEWGFIWETMLEDGAWAVPSVTDTFGNVIKENFAPEMLIKFIAHDLKSHIIVFDLLLDRVQFVSGNHLKSDNVVFDSPLLLYATGGHFQSVLQEDHEFFIQYAKDFEADNQPAISQSQSNENGNSQTNRNVLLLVPTLGSKAEKDGIAEIPSHILDTKPLKKSNESLKETNKKRSIGKESKTKGPKRKIVNLEKIEVTYKFAVPSELECNFENDQIYEAIKNIKASKRSPEQQKVFLRMNRQKSRERETESKRKQRLVNDEEYHKEKRLNETLEEKIARKDKAKTYIAKQRKQETKSESIARQAKAKTFITEQRKQETELEVLARQAKVKTSMAEHRMQQTKSESIARQAKAKAFITEQRKQETELDVLARQAKVKISMAEHRMQEKEIVI